MHFQIQFTVGVQILLTYILYRIERALALSCSVRSAELSSVVNGALAQMLVAESADSEVTLDTPQTSIKFMKVAFTNDVPKVVTAIPDGEGTWHKRCANAELEFEPKKPGLKIQFSATATDEAKTKVATCKVEMNVCVLARKKYGKTELFTVRLQCKEVGGAIAPQEGTTCEKWALDAIYSYASSSLKKRIKDALTRVLAVDLKKMTDAENKEEADRKKKANQDYFVDEPKKTEKGKTN